MAAALDCSSAGLEGVSLKVCCFENQEKKNYEMEMLCERCPVLLECDGAATSACDCFSPISKRNKALTVLLCLHLPPQLVNCCLFESPLFFPLLFSAKELHSCELLSFGKCQENRQQAWRTETPVLS